MVRTQIQLTEDQASGLKKLAAKRGVSLAELLRQAADQLLMESEEEEKWRRAREIAGRFQSRKSDVAERHDDYLAEDLR